MRGHPWTTAEDTILRQSWPVMSAKELARQMMRTDSAIKQRAIAIGLRKHKRKAA